MGALFDRASYDKTVYDSLFQYVPLEAWSLGFGLVAIAAGMVLLNGTWRWYAGTNLTMLFLSCSWTVALLKTKFIDDIKVTPLGFALWLFVVITCLVNAAIPTTVTTVRGRDE